MRSNRNISTISINALMTLVLTFLACSAGAQTQTADLKISQEIYQTFYLNSLTQRDANDIQSDLRNMLPKSRLFYVPSQNAISIHGTPEDVQLAQKILADIDRTKKIYRLTYTITESDNGKRTGAQHFTIVVASGEKTTLKQGNKVPVVTAQVNDGNPTQTNQVQYIDIGLNIDAAVDAYPDGVKLRTKVEQSSVAEEKPVGAQDPVIRQTTLEGTSTLVQGKPLVLGSIDIPGTTRHQEIEVIPELVR